MKFTDYQQFGIPVSIVLKNKLGVFWNSLTDQQKADGSMDYAVIYSLLAGGDVNAAIIKVRKLSENFTNLTPDQQENHDDMMSSL